MILTISTYNRLSYLKKLIQSWSQTVSDKDNWQIIIADDGSTDGTIEFIENMQKNAEFEITLIKNNRKGIHHQTNTILKHLSKIKFDFAFFCNDDIRFLKPGWDKLYISEIKNSGFQHLCFYDKNWESKKTLYNPVEKDNLISHSNQMDIQGAFYTITPEIIQNVGYMDCENFGFRGLGHVDYSIRCARAGFNDSNFIFDVKNSNEYISCTFENYAAALPQELVNSIDNDKDYSLKKNIIQNKNRIFVDYNENKNSLDNKAETFLWNQAIQRKIDEIEIISKERDWYKKELSKTKEYYFNVYERLPSLVKSILKFSQKNKSKF